MDYDAFVQLLVARLPKELTMNNPGGGTSTVIGCDGKRICYKRRKSPFYLDLCHMYEAYRRYSGHAVTSNDLKEMNPTVFDSNRNGHSCHCTFFFMALRQMGVIDEIWGTGRRGNPFGVSLPSQPLPA